MLKLDALQKYENALLENFSPSVLRELKRSNWNGLLREVDRLYATMYHEWDALQKDVVDLEDAVKSLNWTVNPYTREGEEPGDLAREVAQVVTDALWAKAAHEPGAIGHTFPQLIGALVHHRLRGFNVHQIVWKKAGDLVFPARYIQLPPQFMVWETKAGQPDRLLLVEDGMSANGVPFPQHQYIVALNHNGPDHPLYNATFYSLVNWFVAYKFGLGWFMEYAQKYGMPKQVIRYANEKDRQQIVDDLSDETVLNTVLIKEGQGTGFEMQYPSGGAASLPQAVLVQKAEEACHKAILGQTLTSDTSASGGSLAQAKVHAGVQADVVMKLAEAVADVLNQQLVPAIIQANYGRVQGLPIPELRCKLPQAVASIERAQFLKTALEVPGMKVLKSEAYEYLNLTQPGAEDEVFEAQDPNAQGGPGGPFGGGGGFPGMGAGGDKGGEGLPDGDAKDEVVMSARGVKKNDPAEAWLAPLKKKLAEARSSGASLSELREQIHAWKPDRRALADAMARNIVAGFERGAAAAQGAIKGNTAEEEISAENPYGCNQHGHGWVDPCPYGGDGSNGMAGKSALRIAGGAENVNPDPDDDEEEKKKKEEAEAKAKAEEEARKKAEAEQKAKEEAERKAEAEKKEIFAAIDEKDKKWGELAEGFRKRLEAMKGLEGTKEYKKAAEALRKIEWYKSSFAHWKGLAEKGNEEEKARAMQYLAEVKETNKDAVEYEKYAKAGKSAFKALEKAAAEANKRIDKLDGTRKPVADISKALNKLPSNYEARKECAKAASAGKGSLEKLWNSEFSVDQQSALRSYTDIYYEEINEDFRNGIKTYDTRLIERCFNNAKLGYEVTVSRGESFAGFGEYDKKLGDIAQKVETGDISHRKAAELVYEYINKKLKNGEAVLRTVPAVTSTSVKNSQAFNNGVMRLIHLPKGSKALCVAPISYCEDSSFNVGEKVNCEAFANSDINLGEKEIIVSPNSVFKVIGAQISDDGDLLLEEELIVK